MILLTQLKALEAAATPGEWLIKTQGQPGRMHTGVCAADTDGIPTEGYTAEARDNVAFLVALRNAAPSLIARLEEAERLLGGHNVCPVCGAAEFLRCMHCGGTGRDPEIDAWLKGGHRD